MDLGRLVGRAVRLPVELADAVVSGPAQVRSVWADVRVTAAQGRELVGRLTTMAGRLETDLEVVEALLRRVERDEQEAQEAVRAAATAIEGVATSSERADALIGRMGGSNDRADELIGRMGASSERADELIERARQIADLYEPAIRALAPVSAELARVLRPSQIRAIGELLDLVPRILDHIDPALRNLANLAPELESVTERMDNVGQIVEGLPGSRMLARRGRSKEDEE